ncbi:MAG: hypothetical protein HN431_15425 [Bacteroidetes bacterium]|nr:hypothetical protein [Bacteroidota bacterium]
MSQDALPMLEPDEVKVSCPVLRGLGAGNSPRLPGDKPLIWDVDSSDFKAIPRGSRLPDDF